MVQFRYFNPEMPVRFHNRSLCVCPHLHKVWYTQPHQGRDDRRPQAHEPVVRSLHRGGALRLLANLLVQDDGVVVRWRLAGQLRARRRRLGPASQERVAGGGGGRGGGGGGDGRWCLGNDRADHGVLVAQVDAEAEDAELGVEHAAWQHRLVEDELETRENEKEIQVRVMLSNSLSTYI